ncbi:MAG: hypothetical protein IJZ81_04960 [Clostridia bacterium]|nr:hypothetical protein [Clostridia bacterium]
MKIRYCRRCGTPITNSAHALYCTTCREIVKKERISINRDAYNARRRKRYAEKKLKQGFQGKVSENVCVASASKRFAKMSLAEISLECARLLISYGKASQLAMNNMLPEDFGLRRKQ